MIIMDKTVSNPGHTIEYGPDMFRDVRRIMHETGEPVINAVDETGEAVCGLLYQPSTYAHAYRYEGGIDIAVLDDFDCIFLHDCNEYSVEVVRKAIPLWKGSSLVLVGEKWERMLPFLPDIPDVECFYVAGLYQDEYPGFIEGRRYLHVVFDLPREEPVERFDKQHVLLYDEVMSFLFMFSDERKLGDGNPVKKFFVMDGLYENLGLFAMRSKALTGALFAKSRGYIPVISVRNADGSMYSDASGDDIWSRFYRQPDDVNLEEVMGSAHVSFAPPLFNGSVQCAIMNRMSDGVGFTWPQGEYNDRVMLYIREREGKYLPHPDKTLGVLARGTDFVKAHLPNHAIHASMEQLGDKIEELLADWSLPEVYIATEDADYEEYFRARFGGIVYLTDQVRYSTLENELLSEHHRRAEHRDGFTMGAEYILSIYLLSRCNSILASGACSGVSEAIRQNDGRYRHTYIFDLGTNPE